MAITPRLVVGTWVGADDPGIRFRTTTLGQGAHTALPIFAEFYKHVSSDPKRRGYVSARFSSLATSSRRQLSCDLFKEDKTLLEKIFGKDDEGEIKVREFGKDEVEEQVKKEETAKREVTRRRLPKKDKEGFFKRLFKKK
jgi:penicillin-binding protein 1A